jgi:hypothetical protein
MALQGINDAKHWRDRAAEMRALSDEMKDVEVRSLILRLANDYDKLAGRAAPRTTSRDRANSTPLSIVRWRLK